MCRCFFFSKILKAIVKTVVLYMCHFNTESFCILLAHLSRRLTYSTGRPLSSLCKYACLSIFSNIFSSETTGPIEAKFHVEPQWDGRMKVCSNSPGHMTKMAAMPIYGKNV